MWYLEVFVTRTLCLSFCRFEDIEGLTSEKNRLAQSLEHKTKKVLDLETK